LPGARAYHNALTDIGHELANAVPHHNDIGNILGTLSAERTTHDGICR
jgi:hypothetical protein